MDYLSGAVIKNRKTQRDNFPMPSDRRPISPHLTIYRPQITSVLSITHRATGIWLFFGALMLVAWLYVVAYAPGYYPTLHACLSSWVGQLGLLSWMAAFYYHLGNGIRHLFWDIGKGFAIPQFTASGWAVIIFALVMTAVTWGFAQQASAG